MTSQAKKVWAAFTTAFFALVAMLGFSGSARAAATAVPAGAAAPVPAGPTGRAVRTTGIPAVRTAPEAAEPAPAPAPAAAPVPVTVEPAQVAWWALPKDRALPPTIKQRIRAEAHGSTPSTRHLPLDTDAASDEAIADAAVGEAVLQPA
ncbi:DUF6344 domain-containing protein [Streptomyces sp. NBC_01089]|uniref:DUF6344 domain-containing protein n=1 Tax=Streptomyces sp. NBC_01089 TaxID=2903747 RepID=UPI00386C8F62|nr:DUF6344 domain-containing protein [Streptomyces sp. NBC_01089]